MKKTISLLAGMLVLTSSAIGASFQPPLSGVNGGGNIISSNGTAYHFASPDFTVVQGTNVALNVVNGSIISSGTVTSNKLVSVDVGQVVNLQIPYTSVKTFGAKGDGAADDTVACQRCIQVVQTNSGGIVYFPAGTYKLTSTLFITNKSVRLFGDGEQATVLKFTGIAATNLIHFQMFADPAAYPLMGDAGVDGMSIQTATKMTAGYAIYARMTLQSHFTHLIIGDWRGSGLNTSLGAHNMSGGIWLDGIAADYISDTQLNCSTNAIRVNGVGYGSLGPEYANVLGAYDGYIGDNVELYGDGATNSIGIWLNTVHGQQDGLWIGKCSESGFGDGFRVDGHCAQTYINDSYFDGNTVANAHVTYGALVGWMGINRCWLANSPKSIVVDGLLGFSDGSGNLLPASYPQINFLQVQNCTFNGVDNQFGGWIQNAQYCDNLRLGLCVFGRQNAVATDANQMGIYLPAYFAGNLFDANAAVIPTGVTTNYDTQTLTWAPTFGHNIYESDTVSGASDPTAQAWINIPTEGKGFRNTLVGPQQGALIYQVDNTPGMYYYNGTTWLGVATNSPVISTNRVITFTASPNVWYTNTFGGPVSVIANISLAATAGASAQASMRIPGICTNYQAISDSSSITISDNRQLIGFVAAGGTWIYNTDAGTIFWNTVPSQILTHY